MTTVARVLGDSPVKLWNLTARERLERQFRQIGDIRVADDLPDDADKVVLVSADYLFEVRTLKGLLERDEAYLRCPADGQIAAAILPAGAAASIPTALKDYPGADPELTIEPTDLEAFDHQLRKVEPPLLEILSEQTRADLEARLYGGAYKGITDLVTKWLWPRPAKHGVRWCARRGVTPNMVTTLGILLVIAASVAFQYGWYWSGLAAGWFMTYLDTVDGKLARVTVKSSQFGHYFDHVVDIIHPPFWYVFWGMALAGFTPVLGLDRADLYWMIGIGYVAGRLISAAFNLLGECGLFSWRPFDAYFRLITGRRNPCLIILTAAMLAGRPDWGFVGVAFWTFGTTVVMVVRLAQGLLARMRSGPLQSWLTDADHARANHARAYRTFSGTRSAYAVG